MKPKKTISEREIRIALKKFKISGGLIKKLPTEVVPPSMLVGKKYGQFENLLENHLQTDFPGSF